MARPRWHEARFWFSDFYAHEVCSIGLQGDVRVEVHLGDEQPSGLGWGVGRACVVLNEGDLLRVGYGDVLVTTVAGPALAAATNAIFGKPHDALYAMRIGSVVIGGTDPDLDQPVR